MVVQSTLRSFDWGTKQLYGLRDSIRGTRVDFLARLLDLLQHSRVIHTRFRNDVSGLLIKGDVVILDA